MTSELRAVRPPGQRVWLLTAPYEVPRAESVERRPWGMHHVRRDGSSTTVCGVSASAWVTFWTMDFRPLDRAACPACASAFARHTPSAQS
ncbi:hypothetical protein GCM10011584_07740 [Nocardioides phosphati]|uniref:Zinc-ribbon domain-containing protein n=1 Tax=Nocardioides phosphati TaxID=1867775 RepID=A0ABQ2N7D9_9ACTN|nr:hypothetical protein GCM10011584_07740 [Nocardioides phosphati]